MSKYHAWLRRVLPEEQARRVLVFHLLGCRVPRKLKRRCPDLIATKLYVAE
jgi:hypothetical protein